MEAIFFFFRRDFEETVPEALYTFKMSTRLAFQALISDVNFVWRCSAFMVNCGEERKVDLIERNFSCVPSAEDMHKRKMRLTHFYSCCPIEVSPQYASFSEGCSTPRQECPPSQVSQGFRWGLVLNSMQRNFTPCVSCAKEHTLWLFSRFLPPLALRCTNSRMTPPLTP